MTDPVLFPAVLLPSAPAPSVFPVPGAGDLLGRISAALEAHPEIAEVIRPEDTLCERVALWSLVSRYYLNPAHGGRVLRRRGELRAYEYVGAALARHLALDLYELGVANLSEVETAPAIVTAVLPDVLVAMRDQSARRAIGGVRALYSDAEDVRYDAAYRATPYPEREPGESLEAFLDRLVGELDRDCVEYDVMLAGVHDVLANLERGRDHYHMRIGRQSVGPIDPLAN